MAREAKADARRLLAQGVHPSEKRKANKRPAAAARTFGRWRTSGSRPSASGKRPFLAWSNCPRFSDEARDEIVDQLRERGVLADVRFVPRFEEILYALNERIRWFLKKHGRRGAARDLVQALGLPASSSRMMPRFLEKLLGAPAIAKAVAGE